MQSKVVVCTSRFPVGCKLWPFCFAVSSYIPSQTPFRVPFHASFDALFRASIVIAAKGVRTGE